MKKILSGSTLKIIAIIFMVIDHVGMVIVKNGLILNAPYSMFTDSEFSKLLMIVDVCNMLGGIAFPIFCFLVVEGFIHTRNLKKYIMTLGLFAIISEPIYDLANTNKLFSIEQQNVLFTLLIGLIVISIIEKSGNNKFVAAFSIAVGSLISFYCYCDGWYYGILLIGIFYLFHDMKWLKYPLAIMIMFVCGLDFSIGGILNPYLICSTLSLIVISAYNGKRGLKMKYIFYVFYPGHFLALYAISRVLVLCIR